MWELTEKLVKTHTDRLLLCVKGSKRVPCHVIYPPSSQSLWSTTLPINPAKAILVYEQGKTPDWFRDFEHYFVQYLIFKLPPPFWHWIVTSLWQSAGSSPTTLPMSLTQSLCIGHVEIRGYKNGKGSRWSIRQWVCIWIKINLVVACVSLLASTHY